MVKGDNFSFRLAHPCSHVRLSLLFIFRPLTIVHRTQTFSVQEVAETLRSKSPTHFETSIPDSFVDNFFLALMFVYVVDVFVRYFGLGWRSFRANGWNLFDMVVSGGSFITTLIVTFGNSGYATQQLQKLFLVSIAFKLVQRTNSLNMLFKTAV